ncbi:MAG TPA: DUF5668 domain-containing protein [Terriglobales bacterium]
MTSNYIHNRRCPCPRCLSATLFGPAILITVGFLLLLDNLRVLRFGESWPLLLVVIGGLKFAQAGASMVNHVQPGPRNEFMAHGNPSAASAEQKSASSEVNRG